MILVEHNLVEHRIVVEHIVELVQLESNLVVVVVEHMIEGLHMAVLVVQLEYKFVGHTVELVVEHMLVVEVGCIVVELVQLESNLVVVVVGHILEAAVQLDRNSLMELKISIFENKKSLLV